MTLETQKILRADPVAAMARIEGELGIKVKRAATDSRILFKYSMVDSPMGDPVVQECRGLILDSTDDWRVVSWPLRKFFNLGEGHAAQVDLRTAAALEKVDGSCVTLYWWRGEWCAQTLGTIEAETGSDLSGGVTFRDIFWKLVRRHDVARQCSTRECYVFEIATPLNRVVTRYDRDRVVLLSVRSLVDLRELPSDYVDAAARALGVERPASYAMSSLEDVVRMARELPALTEGYVVVDAAFNRVKVKNPAYVAVAHLRDSAAASARALARLAVMNEGIEFLSYFPEFRGDYEVARAVVEREVEAAERVWAQAKGAKARKDFALAVRASGVKLQAALFQVLDGRAASVADWVAKQPPDRIVDHLGLAKLGYGLRYQGGDA